MIWEDVLQLLKGISSGARASEQAVTDLVYDSRKARFGCVFFCLRGAARDGHDYADEAYRAGCRLFVAERVLSLPEDASVCLVADAREALAVLSAAFFGHADKELFLLAVTGTKGKTTVSSLAAQLLCSLGVKTGYIGSNGIVYGDVREETVNTTPESYQLHRTFRQMADAGVRCVVMEVSSQALFTHRVRGLSFPVGVFTNLAPDHIGPGEHPTFEHYRECKASLFSDYGVDTVIYNEDDTAYEAMLRGAKEARRISFSLKNQAATYAAGDILPSRSPSVPGVAFHLAYGGKVWDAEIAMPGDFNVANAMAALALTREALVRMGKGAAAEDIALILSHLAGVRVAGRFESVPLFDDRAFIIDYAHNGYSLSSVLRVLRAYAPKRLVCLFGSVGGRTYGRRTELGAAAAKEADLLIITSDNPDREDPKGIMEEIARAAGNAQRIMIEDRRDAIFYAVRHSLPGDIVLLAGKGHENYQLVKGVKYPFSERALLKEAAEFVGRALS